MEAEQQQYKKQKFLELDGAVIRKTKCDAASYSDKVVHPWSAAVLPLCCYGKVISFMIKTFDTHRKRDYKLLIGLLQGRLV